MNSQIFMYLMCLNPLQSPFWCSDCPIFGQREPLQVGSNVLLTQPLDLIGFLAWHNKMPSLILCKSCLILEIHYSSRISGSFYWERVFTDQSGFEGARCTRVVTASRHFQWIKLVNLYILERRKVNSLSTSRWYPIFFQFALFLMRSH